MPQPSLSRYTKPLTFADCISDELPLGWEEAYDPQVGDYFIDHNTKTTQIEDPRVQWRREQEHMLKDYLVVAQEALSAQKEIYQVKQQRLELAQQEYQQLHAVWEHKLGSQVSLVSGSSSNSKYDPEILKAEIATAKSRVNKLKREMVHLQQELQFKERGFQTLKKIDKKMSDAQGSYKLDEAQAVLRETKAIKKAITCGEKEKQDLIKSLAMLKDGFRTDRGSHSDLWSSSSSLESSGFLLPKQYLDVSSQTDISGSFGNSSNNQLAEKVRLCLRYEEAKRRIANLKIQLAKLDSEAWPGVLDSERDRLILINEKEELLKEMHFISPRKWAQGEVEQLEELSLGSSTREKYQLEGPGAEDKQLGQAVNTAQGCGLKVACVSAAVSDESVAGDSGVYEASVQRLGASEAAAFDSDESEAVGATRVQIALKYDEKSKQFAILIIQLSNLSALLLRQDQKVNIRVAVLPCSESTTCLFRTRPLDASDTVVFNEVFWVSMSYPALHQKTLRVDVCTTDQSLMEDCLGGAQISLAEVCRSGERSTRWYNLLSYKYLKKQSRESKPGGALAPTPGPESTDAVSALLEQTAVELEKRQEGSSSRTLEDSWRFEEETSENEAAAEEEEGEEDIFTEKSSPEMDECPAVKVDKETNTEAPAPSPTVVRPKDRRVGTPSPGPFLRGSTIIRSKTFSPGPQSQYVCRLNRSDSDSSTLSKKPPFVRNSLERRSVRMKRPSSFRSLRNEHLMRTSLDLELDLQATRTWHSQLTQEISVLKELKEQLEQAKSHGEKELPPCLREDERFRLLLRMLEKRVDRAEHKGELQTDKMMRAAAKDVHRLRGQSCKEPPEVQSFREKMAFFTRPRINIPTLSADDV
ncbi:PREDICTED: protein KIBRA [Hipposideros armiger]|uniref:Protein KIBRA n=1 Tax=Hipposideros armiger TaxID=186990 RepID=A0A8B7QS46_HIPAR|nr:PREDICTED: protein KIBRA [Hipposideros armiger]